MIAALLVGLPLVFALLLLFTKGDGVKKIAFTASLIQLALTCTAFYFLHKQLATGIIDGRLSYDGTWIDSMGIEFNVALDGISMVLVLLTSFLVPLIILSGFNKK